MTIPSFPTLPGFTFTVKKAPLWSTKSLSAVSGRQTRFPSRNIPRYKYTINFDVLRQHSSFTEYETLIGFYNQMNGSAGMFTYNDPTDNTATAQVFGTGDGVTTKFTLLRTKGGFAEPVYWCTGTLYINGVANYAYTFTNGIVTFASPPPPGSTLTWTGTFQWLCRFNDDEIEFEQIDGVRWKITNLVFTTEIL
jgi:uncharacterized protein (TIGR02217 family)